MRIIKVIIEKDEYDDKDSAIRERYWIKKLNANLNCRTPSRTYKEYYKEEYCKEYRKEYRNIHKEEYKEYCKEYRDKNKEELYKKAGERLICEICGKTFTKGGKSQHYKTMFHQKYIID